MPTRLAVQVVDGKTMEWEEISGHREGPVSFKRFNFASGIAGLNFELSEIRIKPGYYTPRHRHNFDQIRYVIEGEANIAPGVNLIPTQCGYFPEGVYYGPQEQRVESRLLMLQYPGASGAHFMSYRELDETFKIVKAQGATFQKGVYRGRNNQNQAEQKDGYEALWEAHQEQELVYPKPRYHTYIIVQSAAYNWVEQPGNQGVRTKHLGTFTELSTGVSLLHLEAGTQLKNTDLATPELRYVLRGAVEYEGTTYGVGSAFCLPSGSSTAAFTSLLETELFVISLPWLNKQL